MKLTDMTMKEFEEGLKKTKTLIVPYGTVEAHGTHLPLSTDTFVIERVAEEVARRVPVFVAPPVHYGVCSSTGRHPGTLGITPETLRRITRDIVRDGCDKGFRNFILVSGHAGGLHTSAMKEAAETVVEEIDGINVAAFTIYDVLPPEAFKIAETKGDSHAGEMETSLILHLLPELVKGRSKEEYPDLPKPFIVRDKVKYWPGAVWGNPEKASAGKGKKFFDIMVETLTDVVRQIEKL
ncbi:MAG: creatininase family protein [Thermodesulfobacteriota bacterium]